MHSKMNRLAVAGFMLSIFSFLLTVFSALCTFGVIINSTVGAIVGIAALVASSIGLTMIGIARCEIVQNAQFGDEYAVSGLAVGIVACVASVAVLVLYFVLFK
ncbi:MAG: hypothetical protein IJ466_08605 [Clostridia bacterium]|nr:hypothetical protein [Clostridia bacterium]